MSSPPRKSCQVYVLHWEKFPNLPVPTWAATSTIKSYQWLAVTGSHSILKPPPGWINGNLFLPNFLTALGTARKESIALTGNWDAASRTGKLAHTRKEGRILCICETNSNSHLVHEVTFSPFISNKRFVYHIPSKWSAQYLSASLPSISLIFHLCHWTSCLQ